MLPTADSLDVMMRGRQREREIWSERASEQEVWQCNRSSWCRNRLGLFVATKTSLMQPWQWTALRCSNPTSLPPETQFAIQHFVPWNDSILYSVQQTHKRGSPHTQLIWLPPCSLLSHHSSSSCDWSHFLPCNAKLGVGANSWLAAAVSQSLSVTDACFVNFNPLNSETPRWVVSPGPLALTKKMQQNILNIIQSATKRGREWMLLVKTCV